MAKVDSSLTGDIPRSRRSQTIKVEIYDQTYEIATDGDSEYLRQLAKFVDRRMREISSGTLVNDVSKVAILAALNIANELHRLEQTKTGAEEFIEKVGADSNRGMLRARGLWKDRDDLPDFGKIRREWDRLL